tara:strand:- start:14 stop:283 length:270 start_codon:yes stop_codon:yes gene_type:complete
MSHFYGIISNSARQNQPTARGHKNSGLTVEAQSWEGKIVTEIYYNETLQKDCFRIFRDYHKSSLNQKRIMIADGNLDGTFINTDFGTSV